MEYWDQTLKDDVYLVIEQGWAGSATPIKLEAKSNDSVDFQVKKDKFHSETLPREVMISAFLNEEQGEVDKFQRELDVIIEEIKTYYEDNSGEDDLLSDYFNDKGRIAKKDLKAALKEEGQDKDTLVRLKEYEQFLDKEDIAKENLKSATESLTAKLIEQYRKLNDQVAKDLLIGKWIRAIEESINAELNRVINVFVKRLIELEERYETPLPEIEKKREELTNVVGKHLEMIIQK
jgi:type I restriction enzyme M protein